MKSLSRRIKEKMGHCGKCHGKGWYYMENRKFGKLSCPYCQDCPVCLRSIRKLESVARAAQRMKPEDRSLNLNNALERLEGK